MRGKMHRSSASSRIFLASIVIAFYGGSCWAQDSCLEKLSSKIPDNWICPFQPPDSQPQAKQLIECFAWKTFIAVNWPGSYSQTLKQWKPKETITIANDEVLRWVVWHQSSEVFKEDGSQPADIVTPFRPHRLESDGIDQDGDGTVDPLWDQNGEKVYYETRVNQSWFEFVVNSRLYNQQGQKAFGPLVKFENGQCDSYRKNGTIELRLAWKLMSPDEIQGGRFYTRTVQLPTPAKTQPVVVGLVGMHIARKTLGHPDWIWATFEQIDNVRENDLGAGKQSKPSFNNPDCRDCPVNQKPTVANGLCTTPCGVCRTQVTRPELPADTKALNEQAQKLLRRENSVWQYYELIGTQYAPEPDKPPVPATLRNVVMETYLPQSNCISCHRDAKMADKVTPADFSFQPMKAQPGHSGNSTSSSIEK
jgi:hypothetical protein